VFVATEARERNANFTEISHHGSHSHSKSKSDSHSCESCSHEKYVYKCNNNEWLPYLFDDAPSEDGLYFGDVAPGVAGYIGAFLPMKFPARIQISEPKGAFSYLSGDKFFNIPGTILYLKKNCHHKYEWVNTSIGQDVPNTIQAFEGTRLDFGRKVFGDITTFLTYSYSLGKATYTDSNGQNRFETEFQVLTCKSKIFETPPETTTIAPGSNDEILDPNYSGCGE
jgi:hypothetical protein